MKTTRFGTIVAFVVLFALAAWAADNMLDIPVKDALASPKASNKLDVPFYMAGQSHGKVVKKMGEYTSNKRTNAFGKSSQEACHIAFLSALISLQERAQKEGGNAVIDVYSNTKNQELKSATDYRCAAGTFVANVVLKGTVAELAK
ncbi:MAG TPA: excinuclease ABC subunit A [Myxococcota bacterium]|nr:excinuclease ABC subunit A [Myxococcota bacterium]